LKAGEKIVEIHPQKESPGPTSPQWDDAQVRQQLERLIGSAPFKNSQRYRSFLQYVVERTLNGQAALLKERSIGVDVLNRDVDYDTNNDPIVRITAGEIRKRIAQYYDDPRHAGELRIDLPSGSYVPEFGSVPRKVTAFKVPDSPSVEAAPGRRYRLWAIVPLIVIAAFAAGWFWPRSSAKQTSLDLFWQPVVNSSKNVLLSVGEIDHMYDADLAPLPNGGQASPVVIQGTQAPAPKTVRELLLRNSVSWADAIAAARVSGFAQSKGEFCRIRRAQVTSLADLRESSAILVGGYNNRWIMRLLSQFRFSYRTDPAKDQNWIADKRNPSNVAWNVGMNSSPSTFTRDYGIIARFYDNITERTVVVVSGIAAYGTVSASEFLTSPKYIDEIAAQAPAGWKTKNIEVVFSTQIVDGNTGPPQILAIHVW